MRLLFGNIHVADVQNVICTADTWFGFYERVIHENADGSASRILRFIEFSKDWNKRAKEQPKAPPDASEFDQFNDLIEGLRWSIESGDGKRSKILEAPLFFGANELSWQIVD
jgi:hypothetical protein